PPLQQDGSRAGDGRTAVAKAGAIGELAHVPVDALDLHQLVVGDAELRLAVPVVARVTTLVVTGLVGPRVAALVVVCEDARAGRRRDEHESEDHPPPVLSHTCYIASVRGPRSHGWQLCKWAAPRSGRAPARR